MSLIPTDIAADIVAECPVDADCEPTGQPDPEVLIATGDLLRALAAPVRIAIVLELMRSELCVHQLVDSLGVTQPLVSQHLRVLKSAGVVRGERNGREIVYRLVDDHLAHIVVDAVAHATERQGLTVPGEPTKGTGVRATKQRGAITHALQSVSEFKSAQELHEQLRADGESIGLTTVYRNLQAMADAGAVDTLRTDSGEALFRLCSDDHHHHLVCRECGRTVEVTDRAVEAWSARTAAAHGFTDVTHTLEIFGRCEDCSRA